MLPRERAKALGWLSAATSAGVLFGPGIGSFMNHFGDAVPGVFASILVLINVAFAWKWLPESRWAQAGVTRTAADAPRKSATFRETVQNIIQPAARVVADPLRPVSLLIWIYAFSMPADRTAADAPHKSATYRETVQNIIQPAARVGADPLRPVSLLIWIYAFAMLAFNALPPVFSLYLNDRFGINTEQIGYFFMVFGAIGVLMRIGPVGWFNEWLGEVRTMQVGLFLLLAGFILVPLAPSLPLFIAAQV